jgi:hypothetical protein
MRGSLMRWGGLRASRRLSRSLPWIGSLIAVGMVASAVRRKGVVRGSLDTGLNAVPFVGALKAVVETLRGRDFFPDRHVPR